ncbi:MAG: metal ABC transporter permease [Planctomycetota bacterium]|nr:metal ABC transporter permease [Planctomycetota bacterium]
MIEALEYPFFQRALLAGVLAAIAGGIVGSYVHVKRIASISGGLSHAAFGGVGLGYLLGFAPTLGATLFALGSGAFLSAAYRRVSARLETSIAILWAVGMSLGIVFLSMAPGYKPDLTSYLFGSILFVEAGTLWWTAGLDLAIVSTVLLCFREFEAIAFDEEFARVMGLPVGILLQILFALIALAVVSLIQVVGVILVIALLTLPAAIARQWTDSLRGMMVLACLIGASCTTTGLWLAWILERDLGVRAAPTGPLAILLAVLAYALSTMIRRVVRRVRPAAPDAA